ncbi:hypothetical protein [Actinomadura algeriensis]|uniref:DUF4190 domain-containing protein n=1 Tax=Actinomadura algeriensis TaxID=1679523 RepID=A0ABR9JSS0_9ACTN|nr:hypothetical protein [Actinomadura algeriensis]MBE1533620.1 hypothetical protein [Actinomadura algeriensis]
MSEQPGHPAPEDDRPDGRPAGEPPAESPEAAPERDETPGRPDLPERSGEAAPPEPSGGHGPWGTQEQKPDGEPVKAGQRPGERASWRALWLGGLALLTAFFFYPLGLVLGIAALVVGVRSRREARRGRGVAPGAVAGIALGAVGLVLSSLSVALTAYLWTELSGYQSCVGSANTGIDRQTCQDEWFPKIEDRMGLPEGSMDEYGDLL